MKLYCKIPFERVYVDDEGDVWPACCPVWVDFPFGNIFKQTWDEIWYGESATKFRDSIYDGSLRYCDWNWCPHIADAQAGIQNPHVFPYENRPPKRTERPPIHVNMNYDQTCNLKCPTCRNDFIHFRGEQLKKVQYIQEYVEMHILPTVESLALTGVGEPFMSRVFRNFLMNFDSKKYPHIKTIHFHTNGQLFDEKMYDKMKGLHHLRLSADISIDAATPDVYSKVRPPGSWERLMKNLQFIKKLDNLVLLGISMVVQQENYRQMLPFIELGESLVYKNRETFVEFKRARQWSHQSEEQYKKISLDNIPPSMKNEFIKILHQVERKRVYNAKNKIQPAIHHNLQEYFVPGWDTTMLDRLFAWLSFRR
ncbi:MAG TPA: radical SAM protein [Chitinophagales bacterium]|nr:radical SAM protein [Chitinophagales bacterium]